MNLRWISGWFSAGRGWVSGKLRVGLGLLWGWLLAEVLVDIGVVAFMLGLRLD